MHSIAAGPLQIIPLLNFGNEWGLKLVAKFILGNPDVTSEQQISVSVIPGFHRHNPRGLTSRDRCTYAVSACPGLEKAAEQESVSL